ncbi:glutamyl-tRNA reductase [Peptococcus simiae]|uniref:Glutamyl-tRNA reductase n=1 Tax=Peptococcus simiae TaxID=1643805 RepID=A0ABW9GYK9_9FIRM
MSIIVIGLNHKSAPVEVRERVSLSRPQIIKYSPVVRDIPSLSGCAILSTCNRTEIYCNTDNIDQAIQDIMDLVAQRSGFNIEELRQYIYIFQDEEAVKHLFTVSAGLDSLVLGECQIQGQVQDAYDIALQEHLSDSIINTLFMNALTVGKRVRTETQVDRQAVSISSAAVEMAKAFFGALEGKKVLVLGAGETSELTSRHLVSNGISSIMVANRTFERAQWLAEEIGGQAVRLDHLQSFLPTADLIISSTASPKYFIEAKDLAPHIEGRQDPLLVIDIAVPRDIDPAVGDLPAVTLYDIDDLQTAVNRNKAYRAKEAIAARDIVQEELEDFLFWLDTLWVIPTIVRMRDQLEEIKEKEIRKALNRINHPSDREIKIIEQMANGIVNQWLHTPMTNMKRLAGRRIDEIDCYIQAINDLWDLKS